MTEQVNPFALQDQELSHRFHLLWEPHRVRQLQFYFPYSSLVNVEEDEKIESWSDSYVLVHCLRHALPFGTHLFRSEYTNFLENTRSRLVDYAQEQLLYWHLARSTSWSGHPIESIVVCEADNYFWNTHIPQHRQSIIDQLGLGNPVHYLNRFRLSHQTIEVAFSRLCLVSTENLADPYQLGVSSGSEFQYSWTDNTWRPTSTVADQPLIDPPDYYLPPPYSTPRSPLPRSDSLPPLVPTPRTPSPVSSWDSNPRRAPSECTCTPTRCDCNVWPCRCRNEVCTCNYRPDTPPTPPGITLWRPGSLYLPSNRPC